MAEEVDPSSPPAPAPGPGFGSQRGATQLTCPAWPAPVLLPPQLADGLRGCVPVGSLPSGMSVLSVLASPLILLTMGVSPLIYLLQIFTFTVYL